MLNRIKETGMLLIVAVALIPIMIWALWMADEEDPLEYKDNEHLTW